MQSVIDSIKGAISSVIPSSEISGGDLDTLLVSFAILGILLVVGTILRLYVPFIKKFFLPASLIAGIIGLLLGPSVLGIIPKSVMNCWSNLSGKLIVLVFAPMLMGKKEASGKKYARKSFNGLCFAYGCSMAQYAIPLLLTALLFTPIFGTTSLFGTSFESGWCGGHGTAAGMSAVFEGLGWSEGQSIAVTNATFGLLCGVFGGIILVNIAARRGWAKYITGGGSLSIKNTENELYSDENKATDTKLSVSGKVIDNFAFHAAILSISIFLGWILSYLFNNYIGCIGPLKEHPIKLQWFTTSMIAGGLVQLVLNRTKWGDAVDTKVYSRIQGIALEFLVAGAVASLNLQVIADNIVPIAIATVLIFGFMVSYTLFYARGIFGKDWFESSILNYGMCSGVVATGMLLLKVCDPENKSEALPLYAIRAPFISILVGGGIVTALMPSLVYQFGALTVGLVALGAFVILSLLPIIARTWYKKGKEE